MKGGEVSNATEPTLALIGTVAAMEEHRSLARALFGGSG